jgi:tetratricopeptide (TPR) repeat protein
MLYKAFITNALPQGKRYDIMRLMKNSKYLWAVAIFIIAMALRLTYFFQIKANFPGWDTPTIDPLYHDLWARQIASGDFLGSGPFFRAPFYAYFLGLIYAVLGPSLAAAKIIQHLTGAATCSVIFLFSDKYFSRKVAITAGLLSAFNWVIIYHEDELLLDSLLVLFSVLLIWSLMKAWEIPKYRYFFFSGLLLGLSAITRPNYLAFIPVILIWLVLLFKNQYRKIAGSFAMVILGGTILILPVTLRNYIVGHDKVLIASQGGINFYIGNNLYADGASALMPEFGATWQYSDAEYLAKKESGRLGQDMKQSEVSSFYYQKGFDFIKKMPLNWLILTIKKTYYFWYAFEISNNQNLYFFRKFASITNILPPLFFLISPLSLIGLVLIFRLDPKYHIIGYFIILYMLTVIGFFVNSRFRLPVLPFLIILAAYAFWEIFRWISGRNIKKILVAISSLAALFCFTNIDFTGISHESFAMSHFSLGNVYLKKGLTDKALNEYDSALKMASCVPKAHLNRGIIFFSKGDYKKAEDEFNLELSSCLYSAEAHNNLSVLKRLQGNPVEALDQSREALSSKPQYLEAYINEILALRALRQDSAAYNVADSLLLMFPDYAPGHYFKGKMLFERYRFSEAKSEFHQILSHSQSNIVERYDLSTIYASQSGYGFKPDKLNSLANYELGLLEVKTGYPDSALVFFKQATETDPDNADAWTNLALSYDYKKMYQDALASYKKAIELDRTNPLIYYNCGLTLGKMGRIEDATQFFQQALDLKPDFQEAADKLKLARSLLNSGNKK